MAVEAAEASMAVGARPAVEANTVEANTEGGNMGEAVRIMEEAARIMAEAVRIMEEAVRITGEAIHIIMGIMGDTPGGGG